MLGKNPLLRASFSRLAQAVAYATGDIIANDTVAANVVPLEFPLQHGFVSGKLTGCRATVAPASANLVITALDFDLLIFRGAADIPFAAGAFPADNAALNVSAAAFRELVGIFAFVAGAWRNPAGAVTAGVAGHQSIRGQNFPFDVSSAAKKSLIGVVQCKGAWTPGAVVNQFDFTLDVEVTP